MLIGLHTADMASVHVFNLFSFKVIFVRHIMTLAHPGYYAEKYFHFCSVSQFSTSVIKFKEVETLNSSMQGVILRHLKHFQLYCSEMSSQNYCVNH